MASPLEQFAIQNVTAPLFSIGGHPIAVTNSAVFMMASVVVSAGLLYAGASKGSMIPGRIQAMSELFYDFIANMIRDNVGSAGKKFFPFIFTLFVFTLFGNILGMLVMVAPEGESADTGELRLVATALADGMSLALSNIALRERLRTQALRVGSSWNRPISPKNWPLLR